ncbi:MAG: hypothetical protein E6G48_03750 [Actinobacteria bacterium]|nr:MAG: hypothetical protein E6G48_03750 [Actinomycetota bacterium]
MAASQHGRAGDRGRGPSAGGMGRGGSRGSGGRPARLRGGGFGGRRRGGCRRRGGHGRRRRVRGRSHAHGQQALGSNRVGGDRLHDAHREAARAGQG